MSIITGKILLTMSVFGVAWHEFPQWHEGIAVASLLALWWIVKLHLKRPQARRLSR
jgi:hypothetical protein